MRRHAMACLSVLAVLLGTGCINVERLLAGEMRTVLVRQSPRWFERNRIALVDIEGFIGPPAGIWYPGANTTIADVREKLDRARQDRRVRAVVLRISSPGGEVSSSDTIYREVLKFRQETGKPVVAAVTDVGASGAYYVALAADRIFAAPSAVTGSVGVLVQLVNVEGLFGKIGIESEIIKTGEKKDMGSPTRSLTDEERAMLQELINSHFAAFMRAIRDNRPGVTDEDLDTIRDGRVMMAETALGLHLVDEVGYLDDAIAAASELAGITHYDVVLYRPFPHYTANIYAPGGARAEAARPRWEQLLGGSGPAFLYLWAPGL